MRQRSVFSHTRYPAADVCPDHDCAERLANVCPIRRYSSIGALSCRKVVLAGRGHSRCGSHCPIERVRTSSAQTPSAEDLKRLSLEELLRVELTTVMRVPEPTTAIPAAAFIITQDDIQRPGATSLPEILTGPRCSSGTGGCSPLRDRDTRIRGSTCALDVSAC